MPHTHFKMIAIIPFPEKIFFSNLISLRKKKCCVPFLLPSPTPTSNLNVFTLRLSAIYQLQFRFPYTSIGSQRVFLLDSVPLRCDASIYLSHSYVGNARNEPNADEDLLTFSLSLYICMCVYVFVYLYIHIMIHVMALDHAQHKKKKGDNQESFLAPHWLYSLDSEHGIVSLPLRLVCISVCVCVCILGICKVRAVL